MNDAFFYEIKTTRTMTRILRLLCLICHLDFNGTLSVLWAFGLPLYPVFVQILDIK
jgi:hypothetical protein